MEDMFKKFVYTSVGLVTSTAEKIQQKVDELVEKGNLSEEEGKKVVDDLMDSTEQKKEEFESKLKDVVGDWLTRFRFATSKDLEAIHARLDALEEKLGHLGITKEEKPESDESDKE